MLALLPAPHEGSRSAELPCHPRRPFTVPLLLGDGDGCLFGGSDCISYRGENIPKLGVFLEQQRTRSTACLRWERSTGNETPA